MNTKFKVGDILILRDCFNDFYKSEIGKEQVIMNIDGKGIIHTRFRDSLLSHYLKQDCLYIKCCEHKSGIISKWIPQLKII